MADGQCAACGSRLLQRGLIENAKRLVHSCRMKTIGQYCGRFTSIYCVVAAYLIIFSLRIIANPLHAIAAAALLLGVSWRCATAKPIRICIIGDRNAGKKTIGRFLESGFKVGPVFAPRTTTRLRAHAAQRDGCTYVWSRDDAAADSVVLTVVDDLLQSSSDAAADEPVDGTDLQAIRFGDPVDLAIFDQTAPLDAFFPSLRWRQSAQRRDAVEAADGFLFVVTAAAATAALPTTVVGEQTQRGRDQVRQYAWRAARLRKMLERACARSAGRPLLLVCSKPDDLPLAECQAQLASACAALNVQHGSAGPRAFAHAASRAGPLHLPEELRQRIYEVAIAGGPADAARGQAVLLKSGGAFRAVSGGVIGKASAERLLEAVGWLANESRERRRTSQLSRVWVWTAAKFATAAFGMVVSAAWAARLVGEE